MTFNPRTGSFELYLDQEQDIHFAYFGTLFIFAVYTRISHCKTLLFKNALRTYSEVKKCPFLTVTIHFCNSLSSHSEGKLTISTLYFQCFCRYDVRLGRLCCYLSGRRSPHLLVQGLGWRRLHFPR